MHTWVTVTQHPGTGPAALSTQPFCHGLITNHGMFPVQVTAKAAAEETKYSGDPCFPHVHAWFLSQAKQ